MNSRILITLAIGFMAAPAMADTEVNETLDAAADGNVEVSNTAGSIEIRGWAENKVEVRGTLGDDVEELIFERDGDDVLIKVKVPRHHGRDIDGELTIKVPQASSIEVSGVSADIDVDGVLGEQSLQTVSGNVGIQSASADVEAASVSGDVDVAGTGKDADIEAATVSGDVTLSGLAGSVEAGSVSGDVLIGDGSFDNAELETVNGDLRFMAELRPDGELAMESVNGSVEVEFAGDVSARFDIETFNGSIKNCFGPKPERTSKYSPGLELSFTHGDGDGYVAIETLNGSVSICNK
ncbi:DUF4097 family beta strand repeat protein [Gammaproteobacteria bacterium]|nr:DUF4097 family beta strand repeat protein [Gammaproteobacteria bacterium]